MLRPLFLLSLLVFFSLPGRADQFDDGYAAYHGGKYDDAVKLLTPPAEQGNADAQELLAETYEALGDYIYIPSSEAQRQNAEAAKWYRKAAEQGQVDAQYNLGWMYEEGSGVKRNYVQAYKWFSLSEKKIHASCFPGSHKYPYQSTQNKDDARRSRKGKASSTRMEANAFPLRAAAREIR